MTLAEIKQYDNDSISLDLLAVIEESDQVIQVEDNGVSGLKNGEHWYSVYLADGSKIHVSV